jgi:hypothetical protein
MESETVDLFHGDTFQASEVHWFPHVVHSAACIFCLQQFACRTIFNDLGSGIACAGASDSLSVMLRQRKGVSLYRERRGIACRMS